VWVLINGSRLYLSVDRGDTWAERTPPPPIVNGNIAFVDEWSGWALSAGSAATGCMAQGFIVWRTTDGARSWHKAFEDSFVSETSSGCKSGMGFSDAQHGYISLSSRDARPAALRSSDAGLTWQRSETLLDPPGFTFSPSVTRLDLGAVADFGAMMLVPATAQVSSGYTSYVYRSTDRGATWSYFRPLPASGLLVFLTPSHWLQLGLASTGSQQTIDAGVTWHTVPTDYGQAAGVAPQIAFGDSNTGYASLRGLLQRTTDSGSHWTFISTPGTTR
jgi:photosystem II stability/assembly factor-like uncharacterized protein